MQLVVELLLLSCLCFECYRVYVSLYLVYDSRYCLFEHSKRNDRINVPLLTYILAGDSSCVYSQPSIHRHADAIHYSSLLNRRFFTKSCHKLFEQMLFQVELDHFQCFTKFYSSLKTFFFWLLSHIFSWFSFECLYDFGYLSRDQNLF